MNLLSAQARPFQQSGLEIVDSGATRVDLAGAAHQLALSFRTQRMLLARIHQLQITATVAAAAGPADACTLELRTRGRRESPRWTRRSDGSTVAVLTGPAAAAFARTIDLVSCTATLCPSEQQWRLCLEPYAGSHLRVFFPPVRYSTTLRASEAEVITAALPELCAALPARTGFVSVDPG